MLKRFNEFAKSIGEKVARHPNGGFCIDVYACTFTYKEGQAGFILGISYERSVPLIHKFVDIFPQPGNI